MTRFTKAALVVCALIPLGITGVHAQAAPTGTITLDAPVASGGTASFTVTYANLHQIPEASLFCGDPTAPDYLDVTTQPQPGKSPWEVSFGPVTAPSGDSCVASFFAYVWHAGNEVGEINLAETSFTLG